MKINIARPNHRREKGGFFLVIVLLIFAAIMLIFIAANGRRLTLLHREIRLIEHKQIQRLDHSVVVATTNLPPGLISTAAAP